MKRYSYITVMFFYFIIQSSNLVYSQSRLDSIFVTWNKLTFQSIAIQRAAAIDIKQRNYYSNRLEALKRYLEVDSSTINTKSIRYEFLKTLSSDIRTKSSAFDVIESNVSGYKVTIRNFVVYVDSSNSVNVDRYEFIDRGWVLVNKNVIQSCVIAPNLSQYVTPFWKGFNHDDVIITKFNNGSLVESWFYLFNTLSGQSCFKSFL